MKNRENRVSSSPSSLRAPLALAALAVLAVAVWSANPSSGSMKDTLLQPDVVEDEPWQTLEPGLELGTFVSPRRSTVGDSLIHVVRVDPERFDLVLKMAGAGDPVVTRTGREWAAQAGLLAAINSSMYQEDHETSTELMRSSEHVNNNRLTSGNTVLAFELDPAAPADLPRARIIDRQCEDFDALRPHYQSLVQSIRMVSCERANVWQQSTRIWSHAVIGIDGAGRPLLIHARSPWTTHDFIDILLELPIDLRQLQYAEGGPEAQLFVDAGDVELERFGSFETGFLESDDNAVAWPVPNVIGVVPRPGVSPSDSAGGSDSRSHSDFDLSAPERIPTAPELPSPPDLTADDSAGIGEAIRRQLPRLRHCWEEALKSDPQMTARLAVSFVIGPDGRVTEVDFEHGGGATDDLEACLAEVLREAPFPSPAGGGTIEVTYPFNIDPS